MQHRAPFRIASLVVAAALLAGCAALTCGEEEEEIDTALPPVEDEPEADVEAPEFEGLEAVALAADGAFVLRWSSARDDVSPRQAIRYEIAHVPGPFGEPDAGDEPIARSEPGAVSAQIEAEVEPGRFFVRAVDEAGNASGWGPGVAQRSTMPWVRLTDGTSADPITQCTVPETGRALCVTSGGNALLWDRRAWRPLSSSGSAELRLADGGTGRLMHSAVGHLYRWTDGDALESLSLRDADARPALPWAHMATDSNELDYLLDGANRVWVGMAPHLLRMTRPLALPETDRCATLVALAFAGVDGFAICEDGSVYTAEFNSPTMRWSTLHAGVPDELSPPLRDGIRLGRGRALFRDTERLWQISAAGWDEVSLPRGMRPLGLSELDGTRYALLSGGLHRIDGGSVRAVPGGGGAIAAVIGPSPIDPPEELTLIHTDGAVGVLSRGRVTWRVPQRLGDIIVWGVSSEDELLVAARRPAAGVYRYADGAFEALALGLPAGDELAIHAIGSNSRRTWLVGESEPGQGAIWESTPRGWRTVSLAVSESAAIARTLADPSAIEPDEEPPELASLEEPLPPLRQRAGASLDVEPIRGIHVAEDGRALAWGERQVWRRDGDRWLLIHEHEGIRGALNDAANTWVRLDNQGVTRCVRSRCGDEVDGLRMEEPAGRFTVMHAGSEPLLLDGDGALHRFEPGIAPEGPVPPRELPAGRISSVAGPTNRTGATLIARLPGSRPVLLTEDGVVHVAEEGDTPSRLASREEVFTLWPDGSRWAVLTPEGLLTVADVPEASRASR